MRLRKALHGKEQSCHEDHKGLYERVSRHRRVCYFITLKSTILFLHLT